MDAFFASIEQRDNPEYRGKPVVVGADPKGGRGRGVVSTCSYEARKHGIHSAQPISQAFRRCPQAVFLPVRMEAYEEASREIRDILEEFTPDIEPVSIDEAFLDVTTSLHLFGGKRRLAESIQSSIERQTSLTASLGVAPSKMVAKIASDMKKPRGIVIVEAAEVEAFLRPLPVERLWGVGEKTRAALEGLGARTIGDLADLDRGELVRRFGKHGAHVWDLSHGYDRRAVVASEAVKSVGNEHTFERDTSDAQQVAATLMRLCESVAHRLRQGGRQGRIVTAKVRFEDFTTVTRAQTLDRLLDSAPDIYRVAAGSLERVEMEGRKVRLIGVNVSGLEEGGPRQSSLFDVAHGREMAEKQRQLGQAIDHIKERFGQDALRQGTSLRPGQDAEEDEGM